MPDPPGAHAPLHAAKRFGHAGNASRPAPKKGKKYGDTMRIWGSFMGYIYIYTYCKYIYMDIHIYIYI